MDDAYEYARAQLLGLQFAPFALATRDARFVWDAPLWLAAALAWLDARWPALAFLVFAQLVEVR